MARPSCSAALWSQYLGARLGEMCLTAGGVESALRLADGVGRAIFHLDRTHRNRALDHLEIAFPQMPRAEALRLARRSFEHLARLVVEVCHSPRLLHPNGWSNRVKLGPIAPAVELLNRGGPAILITGHLGNWEVLGAGLSLLGYPLCSLARPIDNPLVNQWLLGIRQKRGMRIITKWDAADDMVRVLRSGGVLGLIADQNAGSRGTFVPFFGRLASAHKSIALLALTQNAPIICGYARRLGPDFRFEFGVTDVIGPEQWADQRDPVYHITARYVHAIEEMVRRWPEQYLWMHRRWRRRPAWERRGRPMPDRIRRNIQELPWIDHATLARLADTAGGQS